MMSTYAEMFRAIRDERTTDPLHVLRITVELIESLRGDTFATITEARRIGATWDQIASALHERSDAVRCGTPRCSITSPLTDPTSPSSAGAAKRGDQQRPPPYSAVWPQRRSGGSPRFSGASCCP